MRELGKKLESELVVVVEDDLSEGRKQQGWEYPDYSPASLIIDPDRTRRKQLLLDRNTNEDIHIFSGFHAYPETYWTFRRATKTSVKKGVYLEAGKHNDGIKSYLRRLRYALHAFRWGDELDYILTMGELGVRWYRKCGFPERNLVPFGYFVEPDVGASMCKLVEDESIAKITFVGNISKLKGVDVLLKSLCEISQHNWELLVVGRGEFEPHAKELATQCGIADQIQWLGRLSNVDARTVMRSSDLLILPSRYDGWGAVVNEALHEGTPVVTTEACGAADLISHKTLGTTVPPGDVNALRTAIENNLKMNTQSQKRSVFIERWGNKAISPSAGATYLTEIISSEKKIQPPWRKNQEHLTGLINE